jgi:hypothetical protein
MGPFGLCGRMLSLAVILVAVSLHPKIPFLADKAQRLTSGFCRREPNLGGVGNGVFLGVRALLLRVQPKRFELLTPFRWSVAQRSMLMPRGRRPSTAARTSLGARKASEIVMLT